MAWFEQPTAAVPRGGRWSREPDRDWQRRWRQSVTGVRAGPFAVVPSWRADEHEPAPGETTIVLDPGRAFGSGHHATTAMCLEQLADTDVAGRPVLDVGTGSGILAIAAALREADPVVAADVDGDALEVARRNAERAGVELDLRHGGVVTVTDLPPFDLVLANLLTGTLVDLAAPLAATVADGGVLVASGVTVRRREAVEEALAATPLGAPVATARRDGWVAVRWQRPVATGRRSAGP